MEVGNMRLCALSTDSVFVIFLDLYRLDIAKYASGNKKIKAINKKFIIFISTRY